MAFVKHAAVFAEPEHLRALVFDRPGFSEFVTEWALGNDIAIGHFDLGMGRQPRADTMLGRS